MERASIIGTTTVVYGDVPPWPANDRILQVIVNNHNKKMIDAGKSTNKKFDGSKSITLVMICASMGIPIPMIYLLKTRGCGIDDHMTYVKEYLNSVRSTSPQSEKGRRVEKQIMLFEEELGMSIQEVNKVLENALNLGRF